jgi:membrane-associated phospholipid phosphatase
MKDDTIHMPEAAEELDIELAERLEPYAEAPPVKAFSAFGKLSDQEPLLAMAGVAIIAGIVQRNSCLARRGAHVYGAVVLATVMKAGLKAVVARDRPTELLEHGRHEVHLGHTDDKARQSFPSGHAAGAVAAATATNRCWPQYRIPAYAAAALMCASRLPAQKHYLTDIVAGGLVGLLASAVVERIMPSE